MDKIREEFEKQWVGSSICDYLIYDESIDMYTPIEDNNVCCIFNTTVNRSFADYKDGYKSKDEEIKKLKDILIELGNLLYVDSDGIGNIQTARNLIEEALKESK